jgi:hypothetical protein
MVRVTAPEAKSDEPVQSAVADADYISTTSTGDGCAFFSRTGISGLHDLKITGFSMGREETWNEVVPIALFRTGFPDG